MHFRPLSTSSSRNARADLPRPALRRAPRRRRSDSGARYDFDFLHHHAEPLLLPGSVARCRALDRIASVERAAVSRPRRVSRARRSADRAAASAIAASSRVALAHEPGHPAHEQHDEHPRLRNHGYAQRCRSKSTVGSGTLRRHRKRVARPHKPPMSRTRSVRADVAASEIGTR